jgi:gamma-glutamyltranspeptidase/glutathione hydrolase
MAEVLAPAITLATDGFPVSAELALSLERVQELLESQESARSLFPEGEPPQPGAILRRPRLAATLETLAAHGRDAFYSGEVGSAIIKATSGVITEADLRSRQTDWVTPIGIDVFDATGWTIPPNSQGYLALAAAWIFDQLTDSTDPSDPAYQHALLEAYRAVAWERDDVVADASTAPLDPAALLDIERLAERASILDANATTPWPASRQVPGGTAFMCTRDASGTGVALIQSNYHGIGSGISAGKTGVFLHDRGAGFNLTEGHANELKPGKRPLHTLSPTLWTRGQDLAAVLGTRGGEFQPQYLVQVAANLFRSKMSPSEAQAAPRWQIAEGTADRPETVRLEPDHGTAMARALTARGHNVEIAEPWQPGWGPVSIILTGESQISAAADPRISTASVSTPM